MVRMGGLLLGSLREGDAGGPRSLGNTRVDAGNSTGTEGAEGENGILLLDTLSCLVFETLESSQTSSVFSAKQLRTLLLREFMSMLREWHSYLIL